jgi:hypothetical protein
MVGGFGVSGIEIVEYRQQRAKGEGIVRTCMRQKDRWVVGLPGVTSGGEEPKSEDETDNDILESVLSSNVRGCRRLTLMGH